MKSRSRSFAGRRAITETDVMLAAASKAVIIAFNLDLTPTPGRWPTGRRRYPLLRGDLTSPRGVLSAMQGMLAPEEDEEVLGSAEVRQIFRASAWAPSRAPTSPRADHARFQGPLVRDGTVICDGEIASLRRFNEDAREVSSGYECGIVLRDYADLKEGDVLETYTTRQVERELGRRRRPLAGSAHGRVRRGARHRPAFPGRAA